MKRPAMLGIVLLIGCARERVGISTPRDSDQPAPAGAIVSNPVSASFPAPRATAAVTSDNPVSYVSFAPGTAPTAVQARIENLRTGRGVNVGVFQGGFDPVAIPAIPGDTLDIAVADGNGVLSHSRALVSIRRPPRIVRTSPPKGQTDVPLNAVIIIVFSEPIDPATLTGTSVQLRNGSTLVDGKLAFGDAAHVIATFVPAALVGVTNYQLVITQGIRDLDGDPLEAGASVPFTTASGAPFPATRLAFTSQPTNTRAGSTMTPAVRVAALDASGRWAAGFTGTVTLTIGSPNTPGGTLFGTLNVAAENGIATFRNLSIDKYNLNATHLYTLTASADGLTGATSAGFDVTAGPATTLIFNYDPPNALAGLRMWVPVLVIAQDAFGNQATDFTGNITVAIGTNPSGGTLSGTSIAAAGYGTHEFGDLRIDRVGSGYTLVVTATGLSGATSAAFDVAPTTDLIAFGDALAGISLVDAGGRGAASLSGWLDGGWEPAWSLDGTRIAFTRREEIFVMNADGSGVTRLTSGNSDDSPAWSPDGSKIVFSRGPVAAGQCPCPGEVISVMNADGSGVTTLGQQGRGPAWSPDGTQIAFSRDRFILVMNADGSGVTTLGEGDEPAWSPDGTKIAFSRDGIWVMNANGSGVTMLTNYPSIGDCSPDRSPAWAPDGTRIAFERCNTVTNIYVMAADGSGVTQVTGVVWTVDGGGKLWSQRAPAWRPRPRP